MRSPASKLSILALVLVLAPWAPSGRGVAAQSAGPAPSSIGPLTFSPDGTLFVADTIGAAVYAIDLGTLSQSASAGAKNVPALDQRIAGLLGTDVREMVITDLAIHPRSRNAFVSVMRGQGKAAVPVLVRVDGAGGIAVVSLQGLKFTRAALPNPPAAADFQSPFQMDIVQAGNEYVHKNPRVQTITDMAFVDGRLYLAGLSNEEFNSTLRSIAYPFAKVDQGANVEIYHGNHGQVETRSPVYTFVPFKINNEAHLIAGYLCTPLVKFPLSSLKPGAKVRGTTIAELGNRNRPLDMVLYTKGGKDFLLMSNNSRGVMKIPADTFASAAPITSKIEVGGVPYETIKGMKGIEQLDLLDPQHSIVLARADTGALNLEIVPLP